MNCRHCRNPLAHVFLDLGFAPPSNAYRTERDLTVPELYFPLKTYVCDHCWLVQTGDYTRADELFKSDYAYFSSTSKSWLEHAAAYTDMICERLGLDQSSFVLEVASNDGYLLKNFVARNIPCLGIEPAKKAAEAAEAKHIPVSKEFFESGLAERLAAEKKADLIVGNNVYAHVPEINDFTRGLKILLKQNGTITLEFQHVLRLLQYSQFDTIYHEHFSYHSLTTVKNIFYSHGLRIFDVQELPTHGGSLRIFGCHGEDSRPDNAAVRRIIAEEQAYGLQNIKTYSFLRKQAEKIKNDLLAFLLEQKRTGRTVAAYGAAAKGNTLLNYAGIKPDLLPFVCDAAPSKQGKFLPGSHIPIVPESELKKEKPDTVLVFPWNIIDEIAKELAYISKWNGRLAVAIPELKLYQVAYD